MPAPIRFHAMLTLLAVAAACACGSSGPYASGPTAPPASGARTVQALPSDAFSPDSLRVTVGDTVTFAFGSVAHNVFFDRATGAPGDIPGVNANTRVTRVLTTAGRFAYECHIHPGMRGTVLVDARR